METRKEEREARQKRRERAAATPRPEAKRPSEEEASIEAGTRRTPGRTCVRGARRESGRAAALSGITLSGDRERAIWRRRGLGDHEARERPAARQILVHIRA